MLRTTLIPQAVKGKQNDLRATEVLRSHEQAVNRYQLARNRMLSPYLWHKLCGAFSATFQLTDATGKPVKRTARTGDHIRISLPAPGNGAGDGFDWVSVEVIEESAGGKDNICSMRLRPSSAPDGSAGQAAHFFEDDATSTFVVERRENQVVATYYGRNEVPNVNTGSIVNNMRNAIVAAGAYAGLSELQWSALIKAFLRGA